MKSTICSFRPLRKFLLAGAVLFSPYLLTHSTASEVCVRQKTVSTQTRFTSPNLLLPKLINLN